MSAIFLAAKQEESFVSVHDIFNVFTFIIAKYNGDTYKVPEYFSDLYYETRDTVYTGEMRILKALGFQTSVNLPHPLAINYLQVLGILTPELSQHVWNYLNDALWTKLYCIYPPPVLACMAIYMAARTAGIYLPHEWSLIMDVERTDMCTCAAWMGVFYYKEGKRNGQKLDAVNAGEGRIVPIEISSLKEALKETNTKVRF